MEIKINLKPVLNFCDRQCSNVRDILVGTEIGAKNSLTKVNI